MRRGFQQGEADGLCGIYSTVNAIKCLYPHALKERKQAEALTTFIATASSERFASYFTSGQNRRDMRTILKWAQLWAEKNYCPFTIVANHPKKRDISKRFLDDLADKLNKKNVVAVMGFGDWKSNKANIKNFEPHWTVATKIYKTRVHLIDSDVFENLSRLDIGINPEPGWRLEDCFLLISARSQLVRNTVIED